MTPLRSESAQVMNIHITMLIWRLVMKYPVRFPIRAPPASVPPFRCQHADATRDVGRTTGLEHADGADGQGAQRAPLRRRAGLSPAGPPLDPPGWPSSTPASAAAPPAAF